MGGSTLEGGPLGLQSSNQILLHQVMEHQRSGGEHSLLSQPFDNWIYILALHNENEMRISLDDYSLSTKGPNWSNLI